MAEKRRPSEQLPVSSEADGARQRFVIFRVERRLYAFPADTVAEVLRAPAAARVPQAPKALVGIANLRGGVLPLVSARALLGLPGNTSGDSLAIVLAKGAPVALEVDGVETLVTVGSDAIKTDQNSLGVEGGEKLLGAFSTSFGVAKILDIQALLNETFAQRAKAQSQSRDIGRSSALGVQAETQRNADTDIIVTFEIAGQEYALPIDDVREIVPAPKTLTATAHTEALVLGMMVLRDELLPVMSLRGLLGFAVPSETDGREKVVVARIGGTMIGLMADRARSVRPAQRSRIEPIPPVLAARTRGESKIAAVYRTEAGGKLISILEPKQLFREDVMQRLATQRQTHMHGEANTKAVVSDLAFLVFRLGKDEFGLPIDVVDEVARVPEKIARVPKTPKFLEGVINLRGAVLPVVDQRRRFDMPKLEHSDAQRLIVVKTDRHRAGLIVDSVSDILRTNADAIGATPELTEDTARLVHGVLNLEDKGRIILLLDPAELLTRAEQGLLDSFARETEKAAS